jgi:hypothetical protein
MGRRSRRGWCREKDKDERGKMKLTAQSNPYISPKHKYEDFRHGWTLNDKIEVFIARVEGWQLGVAKEMIEKGISNRAYALLYIVISYFETIAKYRDGFVGVDQSKVYFKKGVGEVFPDIEPEAENLLNTLYASVRSGLYHIGRTGSNVILNDGTPGSIGYNSENDFIMINPEMLVDDVLFHFKRYATELRNSNNTEFRKNFERKFDSDDSNPKFKSK